ncbi:aminomethyltransferase/hypothetical protein [Granulicella rosea]|uniref:Uncharacterized protein n=1 Tax=Granulicella rosea TaxID=474952 RepID=A0A239KKB0_9BACT|nr:folate-binding protein YgfZ [Granulicella rosea]SNT18430.1 aminomethyltransferase/hypothetical protein [Granulicella rosea]
MTLTTHTDVPVTGLQSRLEALLHGAGIAPLTATGWLRITGEDRVRWLNGMVTNSIQSLKPGEGCYNFILSAQGRIQGDGTAFETPSALLLETDRERLPALMTLLDRFIIMDDVELHDVSATQIGYALAGPNAPALLAEIISDESGAEPFDFEAWVQQPAPKLIHTTWQSARLTVVHQHSPLVPRYELWIDADDPTEAEALAAALEAEGAATCTAEDLEDLRILEGTPLYGTDIRDKELPQETAQTRALHFAKGCYLGQEIVERIRSRGAVHRTFSGFTLTGELPATGTILEAEGKPVGEITSAASIGGQTCALGYIRREALERSLPLAYPGGAATPSVLPFRAS